MQFSSSHPSCVVDDAPQESSALPRWFRSICVVPYPWPVESISGLGDCVVYLQWPPAPLWSALSTCLAWQIAAYSEYLLQKRLALSSGLFRCMAPDLCSILKLNSCTRFEVKGSQVLQNWRIVSPGISCVRVGPAPPSFFFFLIPFWNWGTRQSVWNRSDTSGTRRHYSTGQRQRRRNFGSKCL